MKVYEKMWLAGLGAYGRYEKMGQEGKKLFEDLVVEGDDLRDRYSDKIDETREKLMGKMTDTLGKVRSSLLPESEQTDEEKEVLSKQIEELTLAVKALTEVEASAKEAAEKPAAKTAPKTAAKAG
ncbi:phasin family protein [Kistimonas asteriae]|uniref:phasin family protein n=1 Tax=Kistimonas asteriae TaxID=517724 RepID=UPI001BACC425|nr:phasin family protein [Kistimonas asteriae]